MSMSIFSPVRWVQTLQCCQDTQWPLCTGSAWPQNGRAHWLVRTDPSENTCREKSDRNKKSCLFILLPVFIYTLPVSRTDWNKLNIVCPCVFFFVVVEFQTEFIDGVLTRCVSAKLLHETTNYKINNKNMNLFLTLKLDFTLTQGVSLDSQHLFKYFLFFWFFTFNSHDTT